MTDRPTGSTPPVPPAAPDATSTASAHRLPEPDSPAVIENPTELAAVLADLAQAAVWTTRGDRWQEHASFLLSTRDGRCYLVGFTDPLATELIPRLRALPGVDSALLLELTGSRESRITTLWRAPRTGNEGRPAQIPAQRGPGEPVSETPVTPPTPTSRTPQRPA